MATYDAGYFNQGYTDVLSEHWQISADISESIKTEKICFLKNENLFWQKNLEWIATNQTKWKHILVGLSAKYKSFIKWHLYSLTASLLVHSYLIQDKTSDFLRWWNNTGNETDKMHNVVENENNHLKLYLSRVKAYHLKTSMLLNIWAFVNIRNH